MEGPGLCLAIALLAGGALARLTWEGESYLPWLSAASAKTSK